jgi:transposase-like protein
MQQKSSRAKKPSPPRKFSAAFKKQVVREFERGCLNKDQLQSKYGIKGNSAVLNWCRKYGRFAYVKNDSIGRPMKDPQKQRIKELEEKLKKAEEKIKIYDKLIEVTNRELQEDVIKKIGAKLQKSLRKKGKLK